jgi:hypothetical protein
MINILMQRINSFNNYLNSHKFKNELIDFLIIVTMMFLFLMFLIILFSLMKVIR